MRRRTNAGLTALQAALSGIGGGFAGYAKDTETRKADAERERLQREREEERTYGREMDLAGLLQQGFTTPEQLATRRAAAGPDVANYVSQSVRSMMPGSTAAPPDPTLMQRVLDTAGGDFREGQRLTIGGRELVLPESTPQRQDRLAALARGEARNAAQVAAQQRAEDQAREDRQLEQAAKDRERLARINNQPAPERPYNPQRDIDQAVIKYSMTRQGEMFGLPGALPTEQQVQQYRASLQRAMGRAPQAGPTREAAAALVPPSVTNDIDAWMDANPPTAEERANPMLYRQRFQASQTGRR